MTRKGLFLDRDGVINIDNNYVHRIKDFIFIKGIFDLLREASKKKYLLFIVTNQAGIGRGYYSEEDFHRLTLWMLKRFVYEGIEITKVYFSPYHPDFGKGKYKLDHYSRKPRPGMLLEAKKEFNINLSRSILIGDKLSDIQAGISAGTGLNLLFNSKSPKDDSNLSNCKYISNLSEAKKYL